MRKFVVRITVLTVRFYTLDHRVGANVRVRVMIYYWYGILLPWSIEYRTGTSTIIELYRAADEVSCNVAYMLSNWILDLFCGFRYCYK